MATKWATKGSTSSVAMQSRSGRVCEVAQHVLQHAAVLEVLDLLGGIDAAGEDHLFRRAVATMDRHRHVHARPEALPSHGHLVCLLFLEEKRLSRHARHQKVRINR